MKIKKTIAIAAIGLAFAALPIVAQAQDAGKQVSIADKRVSLNVDSGDLRYALRMLFQAAGADYSIDPAVQGVVTVALQDVPFRTALESVLRSSNSTVVYTYRIVDGVYHVSPRAPEAIPPAPNLPLDVEPVKDNKPRVGKISLNWADVRDVVAAFGGSMLPNRLADQGSNGFGSGFGSGFGGGFGSGFNGGLGSFGSGIGQGTWFGNSPGNFMFGPFQGGFGSMNQGQGMRGGGGFGQGFGSGFRRSR